MSLKISEELKDKEGISISIGKMGVVYRSQGNYPKALDYYLKALKIAEDSGNINLIATWVGNIGIFYDEQKDYSTALSYYFKALKMAEDLGNKKHIGAWLGNIGNVYMMQKDYSKTLEYYYRALKTADELGDKNGMAIWLGNIGMVYAEQGLAASELSVRKNLINQALEYSLKALKAAEDIGYKHLEANTLSIIGSLYTKKSETESGKNKNHALKMAEDYLLRALSLSKEIVALNTVKDSQQFLSELYSASGKYDKALEYYKNYVTVKDSIYNEENTKKQTRTEMNYEFEKKEALAKAEQEKKDAISIEQLRRKNQQRNAFMGGFGLTLLLAGSIFFSLQQNKKKNKIITIQKLEVEEKNRHITDSITYALRIQTAILPPDKMVKEYLKNSFVLYLPKDIVAGDFYWLEAIQFADETISKSANEKSLVVNTSDNQLILFAACDCTGHGVSGAMVSVVCHNALTRSVREYGLIQPAAILDKTADLVQENFEKSEEKIEDGMDISLCAYYPKRNKMQWAGANNSLWLIRNGQIIEYKADKHRIGKYDNKKFYTNYEIDLMKDDTIYLFSDGYHDQIANDGEMKLTRKGFKNILLSIQDKTMDGQRKELINLHKQWKGQIEQIDDICIIGVRV